MKKYGLLSTIKEEDIEVLREYASARTERGLVEKRLEYLSEVLDENCELSQSVWTTQEGLCKPIIELEDDHLKNIVTHLRERGATNSRISKEYQKRFGEGANLEEGSDNDGWKMGDF